MFDVCPVGRYVYRLHSVVIIGIWTDEETHNRTELFWAAEFLPEPFLCRKIIVFHILAKRSVDM